MPKEWNEMTDPQKLEDLNERVKKLEHLLAVRSHDIANLNKQIGDLQKQVKSPS